MANTHMHESGAEYMNPRASTRMGKNASRKPASRAPRMYPAIASPSLSTESYSRDAYSMRYESEASTTPQNRTSARLTNTVARSSSPGDADASTATARSAARPVAPDRSSR